MKTRTKNSPAVSIDRSHSDRIYSIITDIRVMGFAMAATAVLTIVLWRLDAELGGSGGAGLQQLELSYSKSVFTAVAVSWGGAGRELFINAWWLLFGYPFCYAALLSAVPLYFKKKVQGGAILSLTRKDRLIFLLPPVAGLLDLAASGLTVYLLRVGPVSENIVLLVSLLATGKWGLIILSLVYLLACYFGAKKEMLRNMKQSSG